MYYSATDFLGLGNVSGTLVEENSVKRVILIETLPHEVVCPCCGRKTSRVHDYRLQDIKSLSYGGKNIYLRLRKRRYACQCGKRFYEKYSFVSKYNRMTNDVYAGIFNDCKTTDSYKSIAQKHNVSFNTVARVINFYDRTIYKCPEVLSIDEFKGNAGGNKYNCILCNPKNKKVLDILPSRSQNSLMDYFRGLKERENVKIFVTDMYKPYAELAKIYFRNAKIVIDKYHYFRQVIWAMEKVRKWIQKEQRTQERKLLKGSRRLLSKAKNELKEEDKLALERMLMLSEDLYLGWLLKEEFLLIRNCKNSKEGRTFLTNWLELAKSTKLKEFNACICQQKIKTICGLTAKEIKTMANYYRITAYHPDKDISIIMDSYGLFEKK